MSPQNFLPPAIPNVTTIIITTITIDCRFFIYTTICRHKDTSILTSLHRIDLKKKRMTIWDSLSVFATAVTSCLFTSAYYRRHTSYAMIFPIRPASSRTRTPTFFKKNKFDDDTYTGCRRHFIDIASASDAKCHAICLDYMMTNTDDLPAKSCSGITNTAIDMPPIDML